MNGLDDTVLHVFDHSFPIADGYSFRSREIISFLRKVGWRTIHVTSAKQGSSMSAHETLDGIEFHRTSVTPRLFQSSVPIIGQLQVVTTLRRRLAQLVRDHRPALLHVHSPCLNGLAALPVARQFGVPVIYEVRALWEDGAVESGACREGDLRYRISRLLEKYVCRNVDHVVTICEGLRQELLTRGLDSARITVVPNAVDIERFDRTGTRATTDAARLGLTSGKTFGFVGTFFPFEGLDVLMRSVRAIRSRCPQARFVLVGDGPDGGRIRSMARELQIEDAIIFAGRVPHAEVERYYDLIDVLIYPRHSNRVTELVTPLKPLEAMAQGKLVIASDVGGHLEMVTPGQNGMLFKSGDPDSLAAACLKLLDRPQDWHALRQNARGYVRAVRSWERNAQIYGQLYRGLLGRRPGRSISAKGVAYRKFGARP